jgi:hypothetical protein
MPDTAPVPPSASSGASARVPARAWLRPALMVLGGALLTVLMVLADQMVAAVAVAVFSLFMAYWTSPLRSGPHTPLAAAQARVRETDGDPVTIVLWAPGNPGSARLQAAIRSPREDLLWVNVFKDPAARELLARYGGESMLPLALQGEAAAHIDSAKELFAFQDSAGQDGATGGAGPSAGEGPSADGGPDEPRP